MGALAPLTHWLPQDDLLLKNAVEAGASLEALAKGAVPFSRRFSLQELQSRWYSLLYDPIVAVEASVRMIESELSVSTLQSKKIENNKEDICASGKRKTVRKCYYAMRKRICNKPFYSMDLNFLSGPGFDSAGSEPISTNCLIGDQVLNYDGIQELNFGVENGSFVPLGTNGATSVTDDLPSVALNTGVCDKDSRSLGQSNHVQDACLPVKNLFLTGDQSSNSELGPSKEVQDPNLLESVDLEVQHEHLFGQTTDNEAIVFSGSGCEVINSSISGCFSPLQNVGYASPVLQMPVLDTADSLSACTLHDACLANDVPHAVNDLQILDCTDIDNRCSIHLKSELEDQMCGYLMELPPNAEDHFPEQVKCGNLGNLAPNAEEYFEQLSNSLLSFTPEDELLLMDADGKEIIDNSYIDNLSSLLLDYPDESDMQSLGLLETSVTPEECFKIPSAAPYGESRNEEQYHGDNQLQVWSADAQKLSSALTVNPMFPELRNGVICCMLNTEDTEIPDNDDVFLPICLTSTSISWMENSKSNEVYYPLPFSVEEFSCYHKTADKVMLRGERSNEAELNVPNQMTGQLVSEMGPDYHMNDSGIRFELPCSDVQHMIKKTGTSECLNHAIITQVCETDITPGYLKESLKKVQKVEELNDKSGGSHIQKQTHDLHTCMTFQKEAVFCKLEAEYTSADQSNDVVHAQLSSTVKTVPEQSINCTLSDQEGFSNESDSEVPYFSDVEAMIHEMDLCPDDDLDVYHSPGVLRYQDEGARRTIIRLEQAAEAWTQRSISVEGAFAVLYGRHSKYFIKKPEVVLGRGTEDVKVDIDLGKEACASKISRQQATLKLESDGTFHLKNHGKFPIFVNGKEIMPGQTFSLISGCLIEIRELAFLFETNKKLCKAAVHY